MALKNIYKDTRGDKKSLLRDVRPGDVLYVIHDIGDRYVAGQGVYGYEDAQLYSVWVVVNERSWPSISLMVARAGNTSGRGDQSLSQLLHHEREIHTIQPMHVRCMDDQRWVVDAHTFAARVAEEHKKELALANAKKTLATAGASNKKSWF